MKRMIVKAAVLALLACGYAVCAVSEMPAGVVIRGDRITGTVWARFGIGDGNEQDKEILVDCPVPQETHSGGIFRMEKRYFSKKDMQRALRAAGQSDQGRFENSKGEARYINTERFDPRADISREEAAQQAIEIGLKYFDALGVEVVRTPSHIERPYDYDAYIEEKEEMLSHMYSDTSVLMDMAKAQWKRTRKYETREAAYTLVKFDVMADGMRLWKNPVYPAGYKDEPDAWIGLSASAYVLVSDSGVIAEAGASPILETKAERTPEEEELDRYAKRLHEQLMLPLVPAGSWQEALERALADAGRGMIFSYHEEQPYQNKYMEEPITAYGSRPVITEIYPCLSMLSEDEWMMLWHIECRQEYADGCRY